MADPETRAPIRVLLVDDVPLMRQGIASILSFADDIDVVGEVDDGDEVITAIHRHRPDVVLLDIRMARQGGIETLAEIKALPTPPKVVMLTTYDVDQLAYRSIEAGADGFLLKTSSNAELTGGIRAVAADVGAPVSPKTAAQLFDRFRGDAAAAQRDEARRLVTRLAPRERDVVAGIARGLGNRQIAAELYVSETTVKDYISSAFAKLGVDRRELAAIIADRAGLSS